MELLSGAGWRAGPLFHHSHGVWRLGPSGCFDLSEIQKADNLMVGGQTERLFDVAIIGGITGPPESAISEGMRGNQHVLRCGACRNNLLNRWNLGVTAHSGYNDDNQRGPQRL